MRVKLSQEEKKSVDSAEESGYIEEAEIDWNNLSKYNPRKNPYVSRLKGQITIDIDCSTIDYFETMSDNNGIPCETLISLYLKDCADKRRRIQIP